MNQATIDIINADARRFVGARTRLFFIERDGEVFVGYTPRASYRQHDQRPSRAEINRARRFWHYVRFVRRLPFRIRVAERATGWQAVPQDPQVYMPMWAAVRIASPAAAEAPTP